MVIPIDEICTSVSIPSLIKDPFIRSGKFSVLDNGDYEMSTGGFSVVFPVIVDDDKWAFRCWHVTIDKAMERYKILSQALPLYKLPYFIDFYYEDRGIVVSGTTYPTIRMRWVKGRNIKDYIGLNLNNSEKLFSLASRFLKMIRTLHKVSIAHGDLQHENIMVNSRSELVLIDYDSLFIPELEGIADEDIIAGKPDYQHPCRKKNSMASPKADYFSEVVILLGILGIAKDKTLWKKYNVADSDGLLFLEEDYSDLKKSRIYNDLYRFGHPFSDLLEILSSYLECQDINQLEPLESHGIFSDETFDIVKYIKEQDLLEKEKALWKDVSANDTIYSYSKYLSEFPDGKYVQKANKRISEIEEDRKRLAEAAEAEKKAWKDANSIGTIESYTKYLQYFKLGSHALDAKDKIEEIKWGLAKNADTEDSYNDYLKYYKYGRFASLARTRIKSIKAEAKSWNMAAAGNSIDSYNNYLKEYPDGKHKDDAQKILEHLTERIKRRRRTKYTVIAICCTGLLILTGAVGPAVIKSIFRYIPDKAVKELPANKNADISSLEERTEELIKSMEIAKKYGEIDENIKIKAKQNLERLKQHHSSKYNNLQYRYDRL